MAQPAALLQLAGYALGAFGGALVFLEFFQMPSYVNFDEDIHSYNLDLAPQDATEYTWVGRVGAFCLSLGFALLFLAALVG